MLASRIITSLGCHQIELFHSYAHHCREPPCSHCICRYTAPSAGVYMFTTPNPEMMNSLAFFAQKKVGSKFVADLESQVPTAPCPGASQYDRAEDCASLVLTAGQAIAVRLSFTEYFSPRIPAAPRMGNRLSLAWTRGGTCRCVHAVNVYTPSASEGPTTVPAVHFCRA
jgi:hypothetical protein